MDNQREEIRDFLASRRARISVEQAGLEPIGGRRRVPGLRREEVARLAGVSVDYYTRLERGNLAGVSDSVLDALARALDLDRAEHDHLYDLARASVKSIRPARTATAVTSATRAAQQYFLDSIIGAPAFITNTRMDMVLANSLAQALYSDMYRGTTARPVNHSRFIFFDARAHDLYPNWDRAADTNVEILRRDAGRNPHDKGISDLVGELSVRSDEFRSRWAEHNVRRHYTGTKAFNHRAVGALDLTYQVMELQDDPGHSVTVYPAVPGSPSAEGLQLLATWAATENIGELASASRVSSAHHDR